MMWLCVEPRALLYRHLSRGDITLPIPLYYVYSHLHLHYSLVLLWPYSLLYGPLSSGAPIIVEIPRCRECGPHSSDHLPLT